jgi:hypothetical protein
MLLYQCQIIYCHVKKGRAIMNSTLEGMSKEAVIICFEVPSQEMT